ncbi:MAG TPA: hypothetical protein VN622_01980 [Clostridia bacterium]|nr:hypothetical protein [Clostridia bacterium]
MMRARVVVVGLSCGFFLAFGSALHAQGVKAPSLAKKHAAEALVQSAKSKQLLDQSYELGRDFAPEQRVAHLIALCDAVTGETGYGTDAERWSEELYRIASELPESDFRRSDGQSTATATMSRVRLSRAVQMLDGIAPPVAGATDSRASAAGAVFSAMIRKNGSAIIPAIRQRARKMGDSGTYPYGPMTLVVTKLRDKPELAQQVFTDALAYYRQGRDIPISEMQFVSLLQFASGSGLISQPILLDAARELIAHVLRLNESDTPSDSTSQEFDYFKFIAMRAQRTVEKIDPALAKSLKERLAYSPRTMHADTETGDLRLRRDAASDTSSNSTVSDAMNALMSLSEDEKQNSPEARDVISKAFSQGMRNMASAMEKANANESAIKRAAGGLPSFVRAAARLSPDYLLEELAILQDTEVRAFLLIDAAEGIREQRSEVELVYPPPRDSRK